jgi:acyl carrier protein
MNNQKKLFKTVADTFNINIDLIDINSSSNTLKGWDSLGMIKLITELEQIFKVKFDILEIGELQNIKIIKKTLEKKGINF